MAKIAYIAKRFNTQSKKLIGQASDIIAEYEKDGFQLTLRQLYYQFVARAYIENTLRSYKNMGQLINDARLAGLLDWDSIEDRTRMLRGLRHWDSAREIVSEAGQNFRLDAWEKQAFRPEVWIEKDALTGVISGVCAEHRVSYFSCRGYTSQSGLHEAAKRMEFYRSRGQEPIVIHLGDHDPSGKDMTRDIQDRFELFMKRQGSEVRRIALNMDQIKKYNPPPNPAKIKDSRYKQYVKEFGKKCYELDALRPQVIADLIKKTILKLRDEKTWQTMLNKEKFLRRRILKAARKL